MSSGPRLVACGAWPGGFFKLQKPEEHLQSAITILDEFSKVPNCSGEDIVTTDMVVDDVMW